MPVRSLAIVPVRERIKTCLLRRFSASSSDVDVVERIDSGDRRISKECDDVDEVVGGRRDVRNDPMDAITVSDYMSAIASYKTMLRAYRPNAKG